MISPVQLSHVCPIIYFALLVEHVPRQYLCHCYRVQQFEGLARFKLWSIYLVLGSICTKFQNIWSTQTITESYGPFYYISLLDKTCLCKKTPELNFNQMGKQKSTKFLGIPQNPIVFQLQLKKRWLKFNLGVFLSSKKLVLIRAK